MGDKAACFNIYLEVENNLFNSETYKIVYFAQKQIIINPKNRKQILHFNRIYKTR
jgi:hypothetical protein